MDNTVMVKLERELGWKLLENLEVRQFPVQSAFWQYLTDAEEWRLFIVTPLAEKEGTTKTYGILQGYINEMPEEIQEEFSIIDNISVLPPQDARVKHLRQSYGKVEKNRARLGRSALGINESFIYFL